MKALYSSWSRTGSSCSAAAWAWRVIVRNRIRSGSSPSVRVESLRSTRTPRSAIRRGIGLGHARQGRAEVHEVGVRVEDGHPQVGLQEEPLEQHPEGVGLARPALAAEEGVPVEAAGPQVRVGADVAGAPACRSSSCRPPRRAGPPSSCGAGGASGGPAERRAVGRAARAAVAVERADDDPVTRLSAPVARPAPDVDDLARARRPPSAAVMTTMSPGAHAVVRPRPEREGPPVARLRRWPASAVAVIVCSSRGPRAGAAVSTWCHGTSWRMPSPPARAADRTGSGRCPGSMTASRGTPQHTWSPRA